jgi:protein involved in polysaccharide export with SLBB domain
MFDCFRKKLLTAKISTQMLVCVIALLVSVSGQAATSNSAAMAAAASRSNSSSSSTPSVDLFSTPSITNAPQELLQPGLPSNKSDKDSDKGDKEGKKNQQDDVLERVQNQFQSFITESIGQNLPIFGSELFKGSISTFAPIENIPVTPDYLMGPGDELIIKGWGTVDIDYKAVIDRNGEINLPKVGNISVAGVSYQDLQRHLKRSIGKVFRNFELSVTLGKLRSVQIFVLGQARHPGVFTVSSLSTLVNTLFATGGPSANGSMRNIELRRKGNTITKFDLYEFLLKGDKSKDISILPGDIIYFPPVGAQVAIYGSVNKSAIFELKSEKVKLSAVLELAGGLTTTAAGQKVMLERIDNRAVRKVEDIPLNLVNEKEIKDGDLIQVFSIGARFDNAVTLRGNVAAPGRYPWKEGMRISDLVPDKVALITADYWVNQNKAAHPQQKDSSSTKNERKNEDRKNEDRFKNEVKRAVSEINWDYAVVERLNVDKLTTQLITFNLGKAIAGDAHQNLELQPDDLITIFSQADMQVPVANRSVYVHLEGEFPNAGVYKALPGEKLRDLVKRVGGFTPNAFLFGAEFDRESVREVQQKKMDEILNKMEDNIRRNLANKTRAAPEEAAASHAAAEAQLQMVAKMRMVKATGRVVLNINNEDKSDKVDELPDITLEDGDRLTIPFKPAVVNVLGMVYNENSYLYQTSKQVGDYLDQAGGTTRDADKGRMYLLHADGSVVSAQNFDYLLFFNSFSRQKMLPGDSIIVPENLDRFQLSKELKDWTQIIFQSAMGLASMKVLGVI